MDELPNEQSALEEEARGIIAVTKHERIRLGETFTRLKKIVGHGNWETYFVESFGYSGVSIRTARRYMDLAEEAEAEAEAKSARLTVFETGTDPQAQAIANATKRAQNSISQASEPPYRLSLELDAELRQATIRLWASPQRSSAESVVITLLRVHCVKFDLLKGPIRFPREAA